MSGWTVNEQIKGVVDNGKNAGQLAINTIIDSQKGAVVISAGKAAIVGMPGIPENVKNIINTDGYGDVIVGLIAHTLIDTFSDNQTARDLAKSANVYGSTIASSKVAIIQDLIKTTILGIADKTKGFVDLASK